MMNLEYLDQDGIVLDRSPRRSAEEIAHEHPKFIETDLQWSDPVIPQP